MRACPIMVLALIGAAATAADPAKVDTTKLHIVAPAGWELDRRDGEDYAAFIERRTGTVVEARLIEPACAVGDIVSDRISALAKVEPRNNPQLGEHAFDADGAMTQYAGQHAQWLLYNEPKTLRPSMEYVDLVELPGRALVVHVTFPPHEGSPTARQRALKAIAPMLAAIRVDDAACADALASPHPAAEPTAQYQSNFARWQAAKIELPYHPPLYVNGWTVRELKALPDDFVGSWKCPMCSGSDRDYRANGIVQHSRGEESFNAFDRIHAFYDGERLVQLWVTYRTGNTGRGDELLRLAPARRLVANPLLLPRAIAAPEILEPAAPPALPAAPKP